jgi:hypothetical protein
MNTHHRQAESNPQRISVDISCMRKIDILLAQFLHPWCRFVITGKTHTYMADRGWLLVNNSSPPVFSTQGH